MKFTLAALFFALGIIGGLTDADAHIKDAVGDFLSQFNGTVVAFLQ